MKKILLMAIVTITAVACGPSSHTQVTKEERYSHFYDEKPVTLLVMPPINNSTNVEAKDLLYTSISKPLIEAGYYVLSPNLMMDILKAESAYDSELFIDRDMQIFNRTLGADAVIFSIIEDWTKRGFGIDTQIRYIVKSAYTNEILFERSCDLYLSLQVNSGSGTLIGALADLAASAIMSEA